MAIAASGYACLRSRSFCRVYYDGAWIHKYPQGILVEPEIRVYTLSDTLRLIVQPCMLQYTPKIGDIVVDVGAGTGEITLFFSRSVGDAGRVISIEAILACSTASRRRAYETISRMSCC
ncbi:MAG: hypothetical protein LAO31_09060 [Acidobacteriia bacterium]|nr:hypothetical protein [Terriglobia bacterium]